MIDLVGQRFGQGIVLKYLGSKDIGQHKNGQIRKASNWLLQCDCGNQYEGITNAIKTRRKSCGLHNRVPLNIQKEREYKLQLIRVEERRQFIRWYKSYLGCIICGENNYSCLDMHHIRKSKKNKSIANLAKNWTSFKTLKKELKKCIVLCANCHRKLHHTNMNYTNQWFYSQQWSPVKL